MAPGPRAAGCRARRQASACRAANDGMAGRMLSTIRGVFVPSAFPISAHNAHDGEYQESIAPCRCTPACCPRTAGALSARWRKTWGVSMLSAYLTGAGSQCAREYAKKAACRQRPSCLPAPACPHGGGGVTSVRQRCGSGLARDEAPRRHERLIAGKPAPTQRMRSARLRRLLDGRAFFKPNSHQPPYSQGTSSTRSPSSLIDASRPKRTSPVEWKMLPLRIDLACTRAQRCQRARA